jgi:prevent-host-death family protein
MPGDTGVSTDTRTDTETKANFGDVIDHTHTRGPQAVTRYGRPIVVIVSVPEWERITRRVGNLAESFAASPLRGCGLVVARKRARSRPVDL